MKTWKKVTPDQAIKAVIEGKTVKVEWAGRTTTVQLRKWCDLNINHIQSGDWFVEVE